MSEPSLPELEAERDRLFAQLSVVGDFRRGSVSENWRRCGKPNCACAAPGAPGARAAVPVDPVGGPAEDARPAAGGRRGGQGAPRDRGTTGVRGDGGADRGGERGDLRGPPGRGAPPATERPPVREGKKGALRRARGGEVRRGRPAGSRGRQGAGLRERAGGGRAGAPRRAAEARRRHARGRLLSADPGHRGPRRALRAAGTRRNSLITGTRSSIPCSARSPCAAPGTTARTCGHGFAPRDAELGVAGTSMSPAWPR